MTVAWPSDQLGKTEQTVCLDNCITRLISATLFGHSPTCRPDLVL
jgi:hypothetical protein